MRLHYVSSQVQALSATAPDVPCVHRAESLHSETEEIMTSTPDAVYQTLTSLDKTAVGEMIRHRDMQEKEVALMLSAGISCVLFGPPGTGKSTMGRLAAARNWGARTDVPANLPEGFAGYTVFQASEDAIGTTILQRMAIRTNEQGQTYSVHEDGAGLAAIRLGATFIVEEVDESSVGLSAMLTPFAVRGLADDITLADGSTIHHTPGYAMLATMNGELDDLHRRLQDRLAPFRVSCPSSAMLRALGPGLMMLCARMYYLAAQANEDVGVTYRQFELFRDARAVGMAPDRAALVACRADKSAADAFLAIVRLSEAPNGSAQS
jgi:hypothetical protein